MIQRSYCREVNKWFSFASLQLRRGIFPAQLLHKLRNLANVKQGKRVLEELQKPLVYE